MTNYLFVYGTLMAGLGSGPGRILNEAAIFRGTGKIQGQLFDLGSYPGLVYQTETSRYVKGHIFELTDPVKVFAVLDPYEGFDERRPAQCAYCRITCPVTDEEGKTILCQVYIYQGPIDDAKEIESGDYLAYAAAHPGHQHFIQSTKSD